MEDKAKTGVKISLAPLQGYTDWVFRNAFQKYIGGVDEFYTPFLVQQKDGNLKTSHIREIENVEKENLVPQFLCGTVEELQFFESCLSNLGYRKINWNMGCPYPMVTRRGKGAGLLPNPDTIKCILESRKSDLDFTVKIRLGLKAESEIDAVLPILKSYGVKEVIVHPRLGIQLNKGNADSCKFEALFKAYGNYLAYNGDILNCKDFENIKYQCSSINHIMIGRGILKNYWLPHKIKSLCLPGVEERKSILKMMHDDIFETYSGYLSGESQILHKMKPFWEYFSYHFENQRKVFKGIKKAVGYSKYEKAVDFAFAQKLSEE